MAEVSTPAELAAALKSVKEIVLAPGEYGRLSIRGGPGARLRSAVPGAARFTMARATGVAGPLAFEGVRFEGDPAVRGGAMLLVDANATFPGLADLELTGCTFAASWDGPDWPLGLDVRWVRSARVSDCRFDRLWGAVHVVAAEDAALERLTVTGWLVDAIRCFGARAGQVATGRVRFAVRDCLLADPWPIYAGSGHCDCIQVGTGADAYPIDLDISGNVLLAQGPRPIQGIYLDDTPHPMSGRVAGNVIVTDAHHGISTWLADGLTVERNVIVADTRDGQPRSAGWIAMRAPAGAPRPRIAFRDNVASAFVDLPGEDEPHPGFRRVSFLAPEGDPTHYASVLRGPFVAGPHGPVWGDVPLSLVGPEGVKAWARAVLSPK